MSWRLRSSLYKSARVLGDVQAIASGKPDRILRRASNKVIGRLIPWGRVWC